mmetsp:Transcript_7461/g.11158  ORF Transcript_7461/g.11158 Transcript_7461/m.11158 type:complete len:198 (-) Transcript_7461:456-1049(-)
MKTIIALCLFSSAWGFQASTSSVKASVALHAKSKSIPVMEAPPALDGSMVGDVGFDPLGITTVDNIDLKYLRFCELKNGRVAMLACAGFFVEELVHFPGEAYSNPDPIGAISTVGLGVNAQILLACGIVELATIDTTYGDGEPGDYGFDPAGFLKGKSEDQINNMKLKELTHCRAAMMGFLGMCVQNLYFHEKLLAF